MPEIKKCGEYLSGLVKLEPVETNAFLISMNPGLLKLLPKYLQDAICYYYPPREEAPYADIYKKDEVERSKEMIDLIHEYERKSSQIGYYITKDVHARYKELVGTAAGEAFTKFSNLLGVKGGLLTVGNKLLGITNEEVAQMLKKPPPIVRQKDVDSTKWALIDAPFTPILVAQIRALCKKHGIDDKIFQQAEGSSSYYVKKDIEKLSGVIDRLKIVKANLRIEGEAEEKTKKFDNDVIYEFERVKGEIEKDKMADRWGVKEVAGTIILVGFAAFGIGAPLGHDIYLLGKGGLKRAWRWFTKGKNGPRGGGGAPTGGADNVEGSPKAKDAASGWNSMPRTYEFAPSWESAGALATAGAAAMTVAAFKESLLLMFARANAALMLAAPVAKRAEGEYLRWEEKAKGGEL